MNHWLHLLLYLIKQQNNVWNLYLEAYTLLPKIAHDHLKGGKCDYADANMRQETKNVSNTNSIAETDFEMFNKHDNLYEEK